MIAVAPVATLLVACSSTGVVDRSDVERGAADQLEAQVGQRPKIACKEDLPAEVGATIRCELTADDGSTIGATVETTKVDGDDVKYEIVVDDN